jgi:N-acetylglucosamine kinase-like BadF-type ATPase
MEEKIGDKGSTISLGQRNEEKVFLELDGRPRGTPMVTQWIAFPTLATQAAALRLDRSQRRTARTYQGHPQNKLFC